MGGSETCLASVAKPILLYANDIVCIFDFLEGLQRHLSVLKPFLIEKDLLVNFDENELMAFNNTQAWVTRSELEFFWGVGKVAYTQSHTYLGVTFTQSWSFKQEREIINNEICRKTSVESLDFANTAKGKVATKNY